MDHQDMSDNSFIRDTSSEPDHIIHKAATGLFVVMFINQLLTNTATLFDSFVVGRFFSDVCLGSTSIVYQLTFFNITLGSVFGVGSQLECSFALARGDRRRADSIFTASLILIGMITLVLTLFLLCLPGPAASLIGASASNPELHQVTSDYIRGLAVGLPAEYLIAFLAAILPLDGDRKRIVASSVVMILVNVAGDLLNVFWFRMGMFGIGLATSVSNYCAVAILASHFLGKENRFHLGKAEGLWNWLVVFLKRSFSSIFGRVMKWFYFAAIIRIILWMAGPADLTAYSMFNNIRNIMICLCLGLGSANLLVAGTMYEEKNVRGLRQASRSGLRYSVLLGLAAGWLIALLAGPILSVYGRNSGTEEAVLALQIYSFCFAVVFLHFYYSFYVRAIDNRVLQVYFNVFGEFLIPAGTALFMGWLFGIHGVWAAFPLGSAISVLSTIVIARFRNGRCEDPGDTVLLLPQSFFDGQDRCLSVSPEDAGEGNQYAKEAQAFLVSLGFSRKTAVSVSLCIEEAIRILSENNNGEKLRTSLFVRVEDDNILIRLRSYGRLLHLFEKEQDCGQFDQEILSTKVIRAVADHVEYNTALGINNIIIAVSRG